MLRSTRLALVSFALVAAACGTSPQQACKDISATLCNKLYTCNTGAALDAVKLAFGATEADCVTAQTNTNNCDNTGTSCASGKTYDAVAATTCVNDLRNLSCSQFGSGASTPSSCSTASICK
jgi:hypothetical protein